MRFVDNKRPLYPKAIPVFPCVDPGRSNLKMFLTEFDGQSLIQEYHTRDYVLEIAPVRVGLEFDLFSNSNMNLLIQRGDIDVADTLSANFRLDKVFVEIMGELFAIDVSDNPHAEATPSHEGDSRGVYVDLDTLVTVNRETCTYFGEKPYWLPLLEAEECSYFNIDFVLRGRVLLGRGTTNFDGYVNEVSMGGESAKQTKFVKLLKDSVKIVAFTFKASIA